MQLLSIAYWVFIAVSCLPFYVGALVVFALTVPFDRRRVVLHFYASFWAATYLYCNPIWHARFEGRERLPWRGPAVLVANHASLIDILVLFALFRPYKWVSKASNFKLPFIGWNMTLNDYVSLTRGSRESIVKMMAECHRHLSRGTPVLIFPEGTRTRDGNLQAFKDGAFRLAEEAGCPLIPIAVHDTGDCLPKHGIILRQPMHALIEVLEPIDPRGKDAAQLRDEARAAIEGALARRRTSAREKERGQGARAPERSTQATS